MPSLTAPAQTNLQLYLQLAEAGWSDVDLVRARDAYEFMTRLFAGHFRGNGKPFLAHLVGTAGILAELGASPDLVLAGLIHGTYGIGEFGCGTRGVTPEKREVVRRTVGTELERRAFDYVSFEWSAESIGRMAEDPARLAANEREILLLRLSDELEDETYGGDLWQRKHEHKLRKYGNALQCRPGLARALGFPTLAAALEQLQEAPAAIPEVLRGERWASFVLAPASHTLRRSNALASWLARRKLASGLGARLARVRL